MGARYTFEDDFEGIYASDISDPNELYVAVGMHGTDITNFEDAKAPLGPTLNSFNEEGLRTPVCRMLRLQVRSEFDGAKSKTRPI